MTKKKPIRLLVCGGRDYEFIEEVFDKLDILNDKYEIACIIQGDARGADSCAKEWAEIKKIPLVSHPAKWKTYGKAAGSIRNGEMLKLWKPDMVLAFPGGTGTADMVKKARRRKIRTLKPKDVEKLSD